MSKGKFVDLSGQRFGRWVVIERTDNRGKDVCWRCRCDCGTIKSVPGRALRNGSSQSCGCLHRDIVADIGHKNASHKSTKTRLYRIWAGMKARCYRKSHPRYSDYGGRGITICEEWRESFEAFRDWAMANGYQDDLSIERKDNDGQYCPENCIFETNKTQSNNRRSSLLVTHNGRTQTIAQWADECGIKKATLYRRFKCGWSVEKALTTSVSHRE